MGKQREPFWAYYEEHDDDFGDPLEDEDLVERDGFGCVLGAACCMPELHFPSECYTPERAEAYHREAEEDEPPG